jgi:hypothetical protein
MAMLMEVDPAIKQFPTKPAKLQATTIHLRPTRSEMRAKMTPRTTATRVLPFWILETRPQARAIDAD